MRCFGGGLASGRAVSGRVLPVVFLDDSEPDEPPPTLLPKSPRVYPGCADVPSPAYSPILRSSGTLPWPRENEVVVQSPASDASVGSPADSPAHSPADSRRAPRVAEAERDSSPSPTQRPDSDELKRACTLRPSISPLGMFEHLAFSDLSIAAATFEDYFELRRSLESRASLDSLLWLQEEDQDQPSHPGDPPEPSVPLVAATTGSGREGGRGVGGDGSPEPQAAACEPSHDVDDVGHVDRPPRGFPEKPPPPPPPTKEDSPLPPCWVLLEKLRQ